MAHALERARWSVVVALGLALGCAGSQDTPRPAPMRCEAPARCVAETDAGGDAFDGGPPDGGDDASARAGCDAQGAAEQVTLRALLRSLTDLERLTRAPSPPYVSLLASSYDRATDGAQPGEAAWFANQDWIVPDAGQETTLLDATGPGVITRIWSANPSGTLRVYVDGEQAPVLETEMAALLGGRVEPFAPPYAFVAAGGHNFYFPIGFQQRCRVTVTTDAERLYFQIDHRAYGDEVRVEPFSPAVLDAASCEREQSARLLDSPEDAPLGEGAERHAATLTTTDGAIAEHVLDAPDGGGLLRELRVSAPDADDAALRETILTISVDGEETVRAPLGDFFGTGPGWADVRSAVSSVRAQERELIAHWPMPFRERLSLALRARTSLSAEVALAVEPRAFTDDTRLFHARWHPPEALESEPTHDWNVMTLEGEGVLVGNVLNVFNGNGSWWGEGDEKIYVDDESFPSHFGTGTEDFFGYAWCSNEPFTTPLIGQSQVDPRRNYGAISLYRFLLLDAIPFRERLVFDLEVNHWGMTPIPLSYDALVQFYALPGASAAPVAGGVQDFHVPEPTAPPPDGVAAEPYRCGG